MLGPHTAAICPAAHLVALGEPDPGEHGYGAAGGGPAPGRRMSRSAWNDPGLIMYTSGTTGRAKGAKLTHGNIAWNEVNVVVDADFRRTRWPSWWPRCSTPRR